MAAGFGGRGDSVAALLTREDFDTKRFACFDVKADGWKNFAQFILRPCDQVGDEKEKRMWIIGMLAQWTTFLMPIPGEYELITPLTFDFEVSRTGLDVNPFPRKKMEEWIKTEQYRKTIWEVGDGEFADLHCDLDMLERMYVLACHTGEYYASLGDDDYESEPPLVFKLQ